MISAILKWLKSILGLSTENTGVQNVGVSKTQNIVKAQTQEKEIKEKTTEYTIKRMMRSDRGTVGGFLIDSSRRWFTIERSERHIGETPVAIPMGRYEMVLYKSPKRGYDVPLLKDVPGRDFIEIHIANKPEDLEGCIGLGKTHEKQDWVGESKLAFEEFMPIFKEALNKGKVFLTIC